MNSPQLLIASPIRQKPEILSLFLHSLGKLNTAGLGADYMFVDDNTDPASSRLLHQFARRAGGAVTIVSPRRKEPLPTFVMTTATAGRRPLSGGSPR